MVYRWRCFGTMLNRILGWEPVERVGAEGMPRNTIWNSVDLMANRVVGGIRIRRQDAPIARMADGEEAGK